MYISRFRVVNYKSYRETASLEFAPGFNIVSGQNHSGKTALLEALGLQLASNPHKSVRTVPAKDSIPDPRSWVDVSFTLPTYELKELMLSAGQPQYFVRQPNPTTAFAQRVGFRDDSKESAGNVLNAVFSEANLTFNLKLDTAGGYNWSAPKAPSYGLYEGYGPPGRYRNSGFVINPDGSLSATGQVTQDNIDFGIQLANIFQRHVYRFAAERMNVGTGPHGTASILSPNASNLPTVLNRLQSSVAEFRELNRRLSEILPQVRWVSVRPLDNQVVEIVVWSHDPETKREDLVVPLTQSGTGIGQVLAILYVVMTSTRPQTIIIDEPQSFLHPGAARKLVEFLKGHSQHQFIMATHSATIIAAANPKTITLARFEETETVLRQLDATAERGIQITLGELGIRLSDVFGADNILWVEGRTEEKCLPMIVEGILRRPLMGTQILGIRETGDLEGRDAKRVFEIYRKLAAGASLVPPAIGYVLDQECRTDDTKKELRRLSNGVAVFLPRRMYENYLLNPSAIMTVMNSIEGFSAVPIVVEEVATAIESKLLDPEFYCRRKLPEAGAERTVSVDGARVLETIFSELSETRVTYDKVQHGTAITELIIANAPGDLQEIADLLTGILDAR